ncbi:MAG: hypothetical protein KF752_18250 [Pirellulaceae bacterium]|nr:hypothetical protein [Pirellulaceae bacterium]
MNEQQRAVLEKIPSLAGVCSLQQAMQTNQWSVERSVRAWKRVHYCVRQLSLSMVARITSQPIYELKLLLSHHAYLLSEQAQLARQRVSEMREPPLGLEKIPHAALHRLLDDLHRMDNMASFLAGCYQVILPAIHQACNTLRDSAHPLADAPTVRAAKLISVELSEVIAVGQQASLAMDEFEACADPVGDGQCLANVTDDVAQRPTIRSDWLAHLNRCIHAADGILGLDECDPSAPADPPPEPYPFSQPFAYSHVPRRDSRFQDSYNAGVNAEAFLYDQRFSPQDKTLMMFYKRIRELDVPEMMASILVELSGKKPWGFYREMLRQLWDEARHAMMGQVGLTGLGIDWTQIPINFTWSLNLNTQLDPQQRQGVLYFIEQGLMSRTGKRYEWEIATQSGDPLSALFQDFDWADEVLHAQIGRRWYVSQFESRQQALDFGDRAWSQVMSHWQRYQDEGLTEHRNWWPEIYQLACQHWDKPTDPVALGFDINYSNSRADLRSIRPPAE